MALNIVCGLLGPAAEIPAARRIYGCKRGRPQPRGAVAETAGAALGFRPGARAGVFSVISEAASNTLHK